MTKKTATKKVASPSILTNLQVLRAIAALNVVSLHTVVTSSAYHQDLILLRFFDGWGSNGIDIFFVLSGFVMAYILSKREIAPSHFLFERITRIAPLYYFLTGILLLLIILFPQLFRAMDSFDLSSRFAASVLFVSQLSFHSAPLLYDGWTLEFEMLFYLVLALGLFFRKNSWAILFCSVSIVMLIIFQNLNAIAVEFIFGMLAAILYLNASIARVFYWLLLTFGVIGLISSIFIDPQAGVIMELRYLRYGIPAFCIVLGAAGLPSIRSGLLSRLGDASYSIYLIQVFTIPFFYKVITLALSDELLKNLYSDILAVSCIAMTAMVGIFIHRYCEIPLTQFCRGKYAKCY